MTMRRLLSTIAVAAGVLGFAAAAHAVQYPPGPTGTCTDTLKVANVQNPGLACHPAIGDTCPGVGGIVTGFDKIPTGFAFYIQNNAVGANSTPWTGIDVFTGGSNLAASLGLVIGDSVVVYGKVGDFQGETEILSNNNSQASPDIIVRKVGSGPVPPFHIGTANELRELPNNPNAEQWEGNLVRLNTRLRIVRTSLTGGLGFNAFLTVDNAVCPAGSLGPCDTVFVDGNTLTSFTPPPTGTFVDLVQGIYNQRTRGYRIQLRDANDINVATPPNVADAYPVHKDTIRVVFDRQVTAASATNLANYGLASFGAINSATLEAGGLAVDLAINNGLANGDLESVTAVGIVAQASGLAMTAPQTRSFYNGVLTCAQIQAPDPAFLGACEDRSLFAGAGSVAGTRLTFRAVCVNGFGNVYYMSDPQQPGEAQARTAFAMFAPIVPLIEGHKYLISGAVQEFFNETEGTFNVYVRDEGAAAIASPQDGLSLHVLADSTCDAAQAINSGEDWEGVLVKVRNVKVTANRDVGVGFPVVSDAAPGDTLQVTLSSTQTWTYDPDSLDRVDVVGILRWSFGLFRIAPRDPKDIIKFTALDVPTTATRDIEFSVSPNPSRTARVTFSLPRAADVELGVYDLAGRQVATLARGRLEAGPYTKFWTGKDDGGQQMGAGVYFYRLKVGNEVRRISSVHIH
jgi:hypothetical protein